MTDRIVLGNGAETIVDPDIAEELGAYRWSCEQKVGASTRYACRRVKMKGRAYWFYLHRVIMNAMPGQEVDHINGDGLDNRRENLRIVTKSQNQRNAHAHLGTSRFKGVHWNRKACKWRAVIGGKDNKTFLGEFESEFDAADAYDAAARERYGEHSRLNNAQRPSPAPERSDYACRWNELGELPVTVMATSKYPSPAPCSGCAAARELLGQALMVLVHWNNYQAEEGRSYIPEDENAAVLLRIQAWLKEHGE